MHAELAMCISFGMHYFCSYCSYAVVFSPIYSAYFVLLVLALNALPTGLIWMYAYLTRVVCVLLLCIIRTLLL